MTMSHQNNASDPLNAALNYGYGFLEAECRRAINAVGLEPSVGYLHDSSDYQTKESLVYDSQEPFRWLVDLSVIEAFESGALKLHDFYFTGDDHRYRFEVEAKERFISILRERVNAGAAYRGQVLKWDTVIERKTADIGRFLTGKLSELDFDEPAPYLGRQDGRELRAKILALTASEARRLGIGKSTLHYLRLKAKHPRLLRTYHKTLEKLERIDA
jgi:CRISPR-associated protein Cas1